jgi:hypothetical protein
MAAVLAWIGASVVAAPWDPFILVNGAARLVEGQAAHADAYNPIGVLTYFIVSLGMRLDPDSSMSAVASGNLMFTLLIAAWGAWIAFSRLPAWRRCLSSS